MTYTYTFNQLDFEKREDHIACIINGKEYRIEKDINGNPISTYGSFIAQIFNHSYIKCSYLCNGEEKTTELEIEEGGSASYGDCANSLKHTSFTYIQYEDNAYYGVWYNTQIFQLKNGKVWIGDQIYDYNQLITNIATENLMAQILNIIRIIFPLMIAIMIITAIIKGLIL